MSDTILVIEDDPKILELISLHIGDLGYKVEHAEDGATGLERALANNYALVILDVMLPRMNGMEVCKAIRRKKDQLPILMLTAKSEEIDRILGLEIGADDYVAKPFSVRELIARVKALVRRSRLSAAVDTTQQLQLVFGELVIDLVKHEARYQGSAIDLTAMEFDIVAFLASNPGRTFTRAQLIEELWGYESAAYERTINTHMSRLRQKLEPDPEHPTFIQTVRGVGYRFSDEFKH